MPAHYQQARKVAGEIDPKSCAAGENGKKIPPERSEAPKGRPTETGTDGGLKPV